MRIQQIIKTPLQIAKFYDTTNDRVQEMLGGNGTASVQTRRSESQITLELDTQYQM